MILKVDRVGTIKGAKKMQDMVNKTLSLSVWFCTNNMFQFTYVPHHLSSHRLLSK